MENELGELEYPYWYTFKVKYGKWQRMTVKNQYRGMDGELYTENWSSFEG